MPRGGFREGAGRPHTNAEDLSRSGWFARVARAREQLQAIDEWDIVKHAIEQHVGNMVGVNAAAIVHDALQSEAAATAMRVKLEGALIRPIQKDEALTMLLHLKISKHQFMELRQMFNAATNFPLLQHYDTIANHKKLCRPENPLNVTEVLGQVPLQLLLNHTVKRILQAKQNEVTTALNDHDEHHFCLFVTFGMDSATGQRQYKQNFQDRNRSDQALFAVTINPICLKNREGLILWQNSCVQSPLFVRTMLLEYEKETAEYVRRYERVPKVCVNTFVKQAKSFRIDAQIWEQIDNLEPTAVITPTNRRLQVSFKLYETQIDGKVFNILTNMSPQSCPACRAPRNQLNVAENLDTELFAIKGRGADFWVQPMHAWIKFLRLLLNVGYKLPSQGIPPLPRNPTTRQRRDRRNAVKLSIEQTKARIKQDFRTELKLRIEEPAPDGSGSSMDGNTSRRAFKDPTKLAGILGIDEDLVKRFKNVVLAINSTQFKLNPEAFQEYAYETYRLYVRLYGWLKMSPSVHKVLAHAGRIQLTMDIPSGAASESASELCHRIRKDVRRNFTRKTSRLHQHQDLFGRCMDLSDPVISERAVKFCSKYRVREDLPPEVLELLDTGSLSPPRRTQSSTRQTRTNIRANDVVGPPGNNEVLELEANEEDEDENLFGGNVQDNGDDTDYDDDSDE